MEKQLSASWEAKLTSWFSCLVLNMEKRKYSLMTSVKLSFEEIKESGLIGVWKERNAERKTITMN